METLEGIFYEIDIAKKLPSFSVYVANEDMVIHDRIGASILDKLKNDKINIGKDNYVVTIRTVSVLKQQLKL